MFSSFSSIFYFFFLLPDKDKRSHNHGNTLMLYVIWIGLIPTGNFPITKEQKFCLCQKNHSLETIFAL